MKLYETEWYINFLGKANMTYEIKEKIVSSLWYLVWITKEDKKKKTKLFAHHLGKLWSMVNLAVAVWLLNIFVIICIVLYKTFVERESLLVLYFKLLALNIMNPSLQWQIKEYLRLSLSNQQEGEGLRYRTKSKLKALDQENHNNGYNYYPRES